MCNIYQVAFTATQDLAITPGIAISNHTFMDGNIAKVAFVGCEVSGLGPGHSDGQRNMVIIHPDIPTANFAEVDDKLRLRTGQLIQGSRKPFFGVKPGETAEAYLLLLAPFGAVSVDDDAVVITGETQNLNTYLLRIRAGAAGRIHVSISTEMGQKTHRVSFENGELITEEVAQ